MNPWQELPWSLINSLSWWDAAVAVLAAGTAFSSFATMILNHAFSALVVGRTIVAVGLVLAALIPLNSGAQKLALAVLVVGLAWSNFLLATNWCNREHPLRDLMGDLARLAGRVVDAFYGHNKGRDTVAGKGD